MTLRRSWLVAATSAAQAATALDGRLAQAGAYVRSSTGLVRAGVLGYRTGLVSARSDMVLDIGDFPAVLTRGTAYGVTPVANDGVVSVALPASPSSNSRWVRVYAIQRDNIDAADADNLPVLTYVAGNAAATPAVPALPVGAMPVARVLQPANVLGTADCVVIEDFPMTAAAGGTVMVRDRAERDSGFAWAERQEIELLDSGARMRYTTVDGWVPVSPVTARYTFENFIIEDAVLTNIPNTPVLLTGESTALAPDIFGASTSRLILRKAGVYDFSFTASLEYSTNQRAFLEIDITPARSPRQTFGTSEDSTNVVTGPVRVLNANSSVICRAFSAGTRRVVRFMDIRATYLGPLS